MCQFCRFFVSSLSISRLDSLAVCRCHFTESVNRKNQLFHGELWHVIVLLIVFNIFILVSMVAIIFKSSAAVLLTISFVLSMWEEIFVKFCRCANKTFPRSFDVSNCISYARDKMSFLSWYSRSIWFLWTPQECSAKEFPKSWNCWKNQKMKHDKKRRKMKIVPTKICCKLFFLKNHEIFITYDKL